MPKITDSIDRRERAFAMAIREFLPQELKISTDNRGSYIIRERGFLGFFKGNVATFSGDRRIEIEVHKWEEQLTETAKKYETEHPGVIITIERYY